MCCCQLGQDVMERQQKLAEACCLAMTVQPCLLQLNGELSLQVQAQMGDGRQHPVLIVVTLKRQRQSNSCLDETAIAG